MWESGDEDDGDAVAIGHELALQVKARETRHLQIGNQARSLSEAWGLQDRSADPKVATSYPSDSIRSRSDLRKSSSSTTEIMGLASSRSQFDNCKNRWSVPLYECNVVMTLEIIKVYDGLRFVRFGQFRQCSGHIPSKDAGRRSESTGAQHHFRRAGNLGNIGSKMAENCPMFSRLGTMYLKQN